jgi:hypothetical protein
MTTTTINYADIADTVEISVTLASLASSSSWLAGRASAVVNNTVNKYVDAIVSGEIETGTTPTLNKRLNVYLYTATKIVGSVETYPVATATALPGTDAAATFLLQQRDALVLLGSTAVNASTGIKYSFNGISIREANGGVMPAWWGIFVSHDTAVNLDSTESNSFFYYQGVKYTHA